MRAKPKLPETCKKDFSTRFSSALTGQVSLCSKVYLAGANALKSANLG